jgi:hypothetical protein
VNRIRHGASIADKVHSGQLRIGAERSNSGLGLAIVDWIVKAHGGSIQVESQVGQGLTFTVLLPCTWPCEEQWIPLAERLMLPRHAYDSIEFTSGLTLVKETSPYPMISYLLIIKV